MRCSQNATLGGASCVPSCFTYAAVAWVFPVRPTRLRLPSRVREWEVTSASKTPTFDSARNERSKLTHFRLRPATNDQDRTKHTPKEARFGAAAAELSACSEV